MSEPIRVVIVHRNHLFRDGLACALAREPRLRVVAALADAAELSSSLRALDPDVVVLDLALPERAGLSQARGLRLGLPRAVLVMIGLSGLESDVVACCEAGAHTVLANDASLQDLIEQVQAAALGELRCSPRVAALLASRLHQRTRELMSVEALGAVRLTRRELEIIALIEERLQNKEIAVRLNIEVQTVKNHVHNVLEKLELPDRHDAVRYARERGLLDSLER